MCARCYSRARRRGETNGRAAANRDVPAPPHGTYARYRSTIHRCRCAACRRASADHAAATRKSRAKHFAPAFKSAETWPEIGFDAWDADEIAGLSDLVEPDIF